MVRFETFVNERSSFIETSLNSALASEGRIEASLKQFLDACLTFRDSILAEISS